MGQYGSESQESQEYLVSQDNLVEVLVDLGELVRELLVLEVYTLLVENLCYIGDELQPVIHGEPLQTGEARGVRASQVPEIDTIALFEVSSKFTHMA